MSAFAVFGFVMIGLGCFGLGMGVGVTVEQRKSDRRLKGALEWMRLEQRSLVHALAPDSDPRRRLS